MPSTPDEIGAHGDDDIHADTRWLPHRVAKGIFYNALIPVAGRSWAEDTPPENAQNLRDLADASPNWTIAPSLGLVGLVMHDVAVDALRLLSELLTPQPAAYFWTLSTGRKRPHSAFPSRTFWARATMRCSDPGPSSPRDWASSRSWCPGVTTAH